MDINQTLRLADCGHMTTKRRHRGRPFRCIDCAIAVMQEINEIEHDAATLREQYNIPYIGGAPR
jgi:hypothetical protein